MKNHNTNVMSLMDFIFSRRTGLSMTAAEVAQASGVCSQMHVYKMEQGKRKLKLSEVHGLAKALCVDSEELAVIAGHKPEELRICIEAERRRKDIDRSYPVTTEDLEFILGVSKNLQVPMILGQIIDLLKLRQSRTV